MCEWCDTITINIRIPHSVGCAGRERIVYCDIDSCIAPIVKALNDNMIYTRASCC